MIFKDELTSVSSKTFKPISIDYNDKKLLFKWMN